MTRRVPADVVSGRAWVVACAAVVGGAPLAAAFDESGDGEDGERTSRISDESPAEIDPEDMPKRPRLLIEWGNPFLGSGDIKPGLELPGGAVTQPSLWVFGTYRTAVQAFNQGLTGSPTVSEWANRLDIYANLQLTGTERILFGMRPLDEDGRFSGYNFGPDGTDGRVSAYSADITTLFFEGDIGEMFPDIDPQDSSAFDLGVSVGRQPLFYQEGMLIDEDIIDAAGITRNTLLPKGGSDLQVSFVYAWGRISRNDNIDRSGQNLFGIFTAWDFPKTTINADVVYVNDSQGSTDGLFFGLSGVQRIGHFNTSFRVLGSWALEQESLAVSDGWLLFSEVSLTPPWTHDNVYLNAYWGINDFASAARGETLGGPLGRVGILFAAVGLGRYGAPLSNRPNNSAGGALGYQWFFDDTRGQIVFEAGGRVGTETISPTIGAIGARYQQAIGQHMVLQLDVFGSLVHNGQEGYGTRCELRFEF